MQQTVANTILIINIRNSNNLNKFWVGNLTYQAHINKVYLALQSQSVSQWVSDKHSQWSDSGLIKNTMYNIKEIQTEFDKKSKHKQEASN